MSKIAVNEITDEVGTGSPAFTNGLAQSDIAGALNATGTAPIYACRAWVSFNGSNGTILDSGNVSSITKNGTGDYRVNFATAMSNDKYSAVATDSGTRSVIGIFAQTTSSFGMQARLTLDDSLADQSIFSAQVFR